MNYIVHFTVKGETKGRELEPPLAEIFALELVMTTTRHKLNHFTSLAHGPAPIADPENLQLFWYQIPRGKDRLPSVTSVCTQ